MGMKRDPTARKTTTKKLWNFQIKLVVSISSICTLNTLIATTETLYP